MALASIEQDLRGLTRQLGLSADLSLLDRAWEAEIGTLNARARIAALDRGVLVVEVDTPAVMQEISLRRRELARRLNRHLPSSSIQKISVRISRDYGR